MSLKELRYFVALAEIGNFGQAAKSCQVSASTFSCMVKKLENDLGVVLFDRTTRKKIILTAIGRQLVWSARVIEEEAERMRRLARQSNVGVI